MIFSKFSVNLDYERRHLRVNPSLITEVKGTIGETQVDLHYERLMLGQGNTTVTRVHGTIGRTTLNIEYNFRFNTADVYLNGRKVNVPFDGKAKRKPAYAR